MGKKPAKFAAPPVVEVVLSVQFEPLSGWSSAHAGRFWAECLGEPWTKAQDAGRLADKFEKFGRGLDWTAPGVRLEAGQPGVRIQIVSDDDERLIQIQDSRFVYNWRKRSGSYPSFETLLPAFEANLANFERFVGEAKLGEVKPNQWEITYVDQIPKGELWNSPPDWSTIVPSLATPFGDSSGVSLESLASNWRLSIPDERGRVYVSAQHARIGSAEGLEVLRLEFVARGRVGLDADYLSGFELGHDSITRCFLAMTSEKAHRHWQREK